MTKFANEIFYTALHLDIIEELGEVYAWEISYKLAGKRVYVPSRKDVSNHHQLGLLTPELANFIVQRYGGDTMLIPMGNMSEYQQRKIRAISTINNNEEADHNELVSMLKVSYSTVRRYRKYAKKKSKEIYQEELF